MQQSREATVRGSDDSIVELAARVERASRALLEFSARATGNVHAAVSPTQLRALAAVQVSGPCSLATLADELELSMSSASRLVDRVTAGGLLDRRTSDVSRREVVLRVTAAGRRLLQRHDDTRRAVFAELLSEMPGADVRALVRGLEAVRRHLRPATELPAG